MWERGITALSHNWMWERGITALSDNCECGRWS
jgi:hypothetical protein